MLDIQYHFTSLFHTGPIVKHLSAKCPQQQQQQPQQKQKQQQKQQKQQQ